MMVSPGIFRLGFIAIFLGTAFSVAAQNGTRPPPPESVFDMPGRHRFHMRLAGAMRAALARGDYETMERICREGVALLPENPTWHYNLSCALARLSRREQALESLETAVHLGFRDSAALQEDPDLAGLREAPEFAEILAAARVAPEKVEGAFDRRPTPVVQGKAWVSETNTTWNFDLGCFQTYFELPEAPTSEIVCRDMGEAGEWINRWYSEGTAAGNHGDYYDNRDRGHSSPGIERLPQVTEIHYAPAVKERDLDWGISRFLFNGVVVGNCSMAQTHPVFWRSLPRMAIADAGISTLLFMQYLHNQLYVYPSHKDFVPGSLGGHGDVFPARTPYTLISRGSSYTDKPFLEAVFLTLAAFRPEVKKHLAAEGLLMPTVQMILRTSALEKDGDYLTPAAHPLCMPEDFPEPLRMVQMAHAMKIDDVPPGVNLRMLEESQMHFGQDFFDTRRNEGLFDTPGAIARVVRGMPYRRRYLVSAEGTRSSADRALRFQWKLLQGDPEKVSINPLNAEGSRVEILLDHHEPFPVPGSPEIESSRVDIAVAVFNGKHFSAPGFVSFFYLPNEKRLYSSDKRILSVDYAAARNEYVDPMISLPRDWRDDYLYSPDKQIKGWLRIQTGKVDTYTADGWVAVHKDARGRALEARSVQYVPRQEGDNQIPELVPVSGHKRAVYEYASDKDFRGRIVKEVDLR